MGIKLTIENGSTDANGQRLVCTFTIDSRIEFLQDLPIEEMKQMALSQLDVSDGFYVEDRLEFISQSAVDGEVEMLHYSPNTTIVEVYYIYPIDVDADEILDEFGKIGGDCEVQNRAIFDSHNFHGIKVVRDSSIIYNYLAMCEEAMYLISSRQFEDAEKIIKEYAEDLVKIN